MRTVKDKPALRPRSGVVIGKTRSGKAVYDKATNPHHQGFSEEDHLDAARHHVRAVIPISHEIKKMYGAKSDPAAKAALIRRRGHHRKMAQLHLDMAGQAKLIAG